MTWNTLTYKLGKDPGGARWIKCLNEGCPSNGNPSYHPRDIESLYCGGCGRWHLVGPQDLH